MNYIEAINKFWQVQEEGDLSTTDIALYFHLLHICNQLRWKSEFKRQNKRIECDLRISYNTLKSSRERLSDLNLISFKSEKGIGNVSYSLLTSSNSDDLSDDLSDEAGKMDETSPPTSSNSDDLFDDINKTIKQNNNILYNTNSNFVSKFKSKEFVEVWNQLKAMPKWKAKVPASILLALEMLNPYSEDFAIHFLKFAVENELHQFKGYQIEFLYREYQKLNKVAETDAKQSKKLGLASPKLLEEYEKHEKEKKRFKPPTVDEVRNYCEERKNNIDPEYYVNHYIARGWKLSTGVKMVDWKASIRTWERNNFNQKSGTVSQNKPTEYELEQRTALAKKVDEAKLTKVTPQEYRDMKAAGIDVSKEMTPEELEEVRKQINSLQ